MVGEGRRREGKGIDIRIEMKGYVQRSKTASLER
jgi:hypothetical protein